MLKLSVLFILIFAFSFHKVSAQNSADFDDGFRVGATLNYGGIYYESNGGALNDIWSSSFGYEAHVLYGYNLSTIISIESGVHFFFNRYRFDEQRIPATNEQGNPTGDFIRSSMSGSVGTTYIGFPVNLIIRPLENRSFYALIGSELAYKIAQSNGIITTVFETESEEENVVLFEDIYDIPERSNNTQLFVNIGIGYSFDTHYIPLNIQIGAKQALTPYMSGDNFIKSWLQNFSLTVSYRF